MELPKNYLSFRPIIQKNLISFYTSNIHKYDQQYFIYQFSNHYILLIYSNYKILDLIFFLSLSTISVLMVIVF